jgi:hypothetical protein
MRNLTITRRKSIVASLATVKVYIEDSSCHELMINGVPCRKLGTLRNGESNTFSISNGAAKVFVIADKLSKGFSNDFYQLTAGNEDISLSGQNKLNPTTGNPFLFDNNRNFEVLANRQKNKKIGILIMAVAAIVGFILGCAFIPRLIAPTGDNKTYKNTEFQITLTDDFEKQKIEGQTFSYVSDDVAIFCLKEDFDLINATSLENYLSIILEANNISSQNIIRDDGLLGFYYAAPVKNNGKTELYHYYAYVYESDDAYWLMQFALRADLVSEYLPKITEWAKSVEFK